jgi:hypothetical protein
VTCQVAIAAGSFLSLDFGGKRDLLMTFLNCSENLRCHNPEVRSVAVQLFCGNYGLFRVLHSIHRGVERQEKNYGEGLDIFPSCSKITNGSALPKSV